jgi:uncharacterized protein (DUF58 family)
VTRFGWSLLVAAVALVAVAWRLDWVVLAVVGAGALGFVAVALVFLVWPVQLQVTREIQPRRVGRTAEALAYFDIANGGRLPAPSVTASQTFGELEVRLVLPRLAPRQRAVRTLRLPTDRRGIYDIGALETTRADPLRIVRRAWRYGEPDELWVFPRLLPLKPIPTGLTRPMEGVASDTAPQGSITFHRLREYEVGDDIRLVHWKSTARTGTLMVRHNIDTSQPFSVVLLDLRPGLYTEESFELALDATASVIAASTAGRSPVQLRTTAGHRIGGPSNRSADPLLDRLITIEPDAVGSMEEELTLLRSEKGGTLLTVITGAVDQGELVGMARLRRRFRRVLVLGIGDPDRTGLAGASAAGVGAVAVSTGEEITSAWNRLVAS